MKKRKIVFVVGFVFALIITLFTTQNISSASECRIVRILAFTQYQHVNLDPKTSYINKGDCVIWFNNAGQSEARIIFEDGKVCTDVVEASMDFKLDENDCFITKTYLPPRGTASLAFTKKGTFNYVVEVKGTALKIKGQIQVK